MTLYQADDAWNRVSKAPNGRPDRLLGSGADAAFPGYENDVGYLAHGVKVLAGRLGRAYEPHVRFIRAGRILMTGQKDSETALLVPAKPVMEG